MARRIGEWIADEGTDTLVHGETRHKLERRAMAVLMQLADKPNQVISKDELIDRVWGGVAVSDHSVAIVISQLRRAFGDDRAAPTYIETIAKRGYRLIAAVDEVADPAPEVAPPLPAPPPLTPPPPPARPAPRLNRRLLLLGGGALTAAAVVGAGVYFVAAKPRYAVAITDFTATEGEGDTGQTAFALSQIVSTRLFEQIGDRALRWRGATTPEGLGQLRANARGQANVALLTGYVFRDRGMTVASIELRDARSNAVLKASVYPLEGVSLIAQGGTIAHDVAQAAGYAISGGDNNTNVPAEAWARYWEARYTSAQGGPGARRRARDMLMLLIYDYPNFARAHVSLAAIYAETTPETLGLPGFDTFAAAREQLEIARQLAGETADTAILSAFLDFITRRSFADALASARRATLIEPSRAEAWQVLALILSVGGRDDEALTAVRRAAELDPASMEILWDEVFYLYAAGRHQQALSKGQYASRISGPWPLYMALIYDALGRRDDAFAQWTERARKRQLSEPDIASAQRAYAQRGVQAGYATLVGFIGADYRESGVPLAVLRINAGDRDGAVAALLAEADVRDRWLSQFVDRIVNLRDLRREPRLAQMFDELEDFRG
ncbi:winged helix-turn-helix domain-containing protein [Terricaulis sp.]|uniref:winged helix-turn-helix domain-containing protein n=1 Tax=Terricaulis sp. TaxID=2768686 RepID=UPI00378322A6